ncbi:DUF427 domain-containing protein [Micromonospora sp. BRA006-A]|nr:DUF427 domain-containing protein [Micromonospora sp. BRA006-A]
MPKAVWNDLVVAESDDTVVVEGNHYFPRAALRDDLIGSPTPTVCPWKGTASYYTLEHGGATSPDAVWYYPEPKPEAEMVRDRVAFWKDVRVVD